MKESKEWIENRNIGIAQGNLDMIIQELNWRTESGRGLWKDKDLLKMAKRALTCLEKKEVDHVFEA